MSYYSNAFSHNVSTMFALARVTKQFLQSLPTEFTKKQFDEMRKDCKDHPLSLQICRDYGFITVIRTEPTTKTYTTHETIWTDSKGRKYDYDEMHEFGHRTIAMLFNRPEFDQYHMSIYQLPHEDAKIEHPCVRNIYTFNAEKFADFVWENA